MPEGETIIGMDRRSSQGAVPRSATNRWASPDRAAICCAIGFLVAGCAMTGPVASSDSGQQELAFSAYKLGDTLLAHSEWAETVERRSADTAMRLFGESLAAFEESYGAAHPILLPVLARIGLIHASRREDGAANAARARAERIARSSFPEGHFLRERFGNAHAAVLLHPLEILHLLHAAEYSQPHAVASKAGRSL